MTAQSAADRPGAETAAQPMLVLPLAPFRLCTAPLFQDQHDHGRRSATDESAQPPAAGSGASSARPSRSSWPIILANVAINVMTATDFMMLGLAVAARARRRRARLLSLSAAVPARHRRRRRPVADRRCQGRRRRRAGTTLRRATHQALLSAVLISAVPGSRCGRPSRSDCDRRTARPRARRRCVSCAAFNGAWRQACCSSPPVRPFPRSSARVRRWSRVWWPSRSTLSPIMPSIFGKLGMPALGIVGSGLATTLSEALMFADPGRRPR